MKIVTSLLFFVFFSCGGPQVLIKKISIARPTNGVVVHEIVTGRHCTEFSAKGFEFALGDALTKAPVGTIGFVNVEFFKVIYFWGIMPNCYEVKGYPLIMNNKKT